MTDIGDQGVEKFESSLAQLHELAQSPLTDDYALEIYFSGMPLDTDDHLTRAFTVVESARPSAAQIIRESFSRLYQFSAVCVIEDVDPDVFFPANISDFEEARAVCNRCPVQEDCLDYALTHNEKFGFWGGMSEEERRELLVAGD